MKRSTAVSKNHPEELGIRFYHVTEIRMGSPYHVGQIRWSGEWMLNLPTTDWQDRLAWREDGDAVALVRWDTPGNQPGFRIVVIDGVARTVETSERFPGCCEALAWVGLDTRAWRAFPDQAGCYRIQGAGVIDGTCILTPAS